MEITKAATSWSLQLLNTLEQKKKKQKKNRCATKKHSFHTWKWTELEDTHCPISKPMVKWSAKVYGKV